MDKGIITSLKHKFCRHLVCKFLQRITTTKECYKVSFFDAKSMLAASWNAVGWETIANCYQKTRFCETPQPHNEEDDDSEVSPHTWEDVKEKMNVTFTFEKYVEAYDNLLPCAVQKIDNLCTEDKNRAPDDEAAVCKPIPKGSEAMQCSDTYRHFLSGIPDVPESIVTNLREVENFTSNLFERQVKQMMLDMFFKKE
jgi:hypothetical protein